MINFANLLLNLKHSTRLFVPRMFTETTRPLVEIYALVSLSLSTWDLYVLVDNMKLLHWRGRLQTYNYVKSFHSFSCGRGLTSLYNNVIVQQFLNHVQPKDIMKHKAIYLLGRLRKVSYSIIMLSTTVEFHLNKSCLIGLYHVNYWTSKLNFATHQSLTIWDM